MPKMIARSGHDDLVPMTPEEEAAHDAAVSDAQATSAVLDALDVNRKTVRDRATQALDANADYLNVASPTNAQVVAQVRRLTRMVNALIRLELGALEDVMDTQE